MPQASSARLAGLKNFSLCSAGFSAASAAKSSRFTGRNSKRALITSTMDEASQAMAAGPAAGAAQASARASSETSQMKTLAEVVEKDDALSGDRKFRNSSAAAAALTVMPAPSRRRPVKNTKMESTGSSLFFQRMAVSE